MHNPQDHIKRGFFWLGSASLYMRLLDFGSTLVVMWYLTEQDMGLAALSWSVAVFLEAFNGLGVGTSLVQARQLTRREMDSLFWFSSGLAILLMLGILIASPAIAGFYGDDRLIPMIAVSSSKLIFVGIALVPLQLLNRELRFKQVGEVQAKSTTWAAMVRIGLAVAGAGAWAPIVANGAHGLFILVSVYRVAPFWPRRHFLFSEIRRHVSFGIRVATSGILYHFYRNADFLLVGKFLGMEALGVYRVAFEIAMSVAEAITNVVSRVAYPVFARIASDARRLVEVFQRMARYMLLLVGPVAIYLAFVPSEIIRLVTSDRWLPAAPAVTVLCFAAVLRSLAQVFPQLFHAAGKPEYAIVDSAVSLVVLSGAFALGLVFFRDTLGVLAVCYAWVVSYPLLMLVLFWLTRRILPFSISSYLGNLGRPLLGLLVAAIPMGGLFLLELDRYHPLVPVLALGLAGLFTYAIYLRVALRMRLGDIVPNRRAEVERQMGQGGKAPVLLEEGQIEPVEAEVSPTTEPLPSVSVVIRSFNRLDACLDLIPEVLAQDHPQLEVVVVEQSTAQTEAQRESLAALEGAHPNLRVVRYPPLGPARARNKGWQLARHEIVLFLDDDDLPLRRDWVLAHAENYRDPLCVAVTGRLVERPDDDPIPHNTRRNRRLCLRYSFLKMPRARVRHTMRIRGVTALQGGNVSLRRRVIERVGGWDEDVDGHDENSFDFRFARRREPGEYYLFEPRAVVLRRLDIPGGMGRRSADVQTILAHELSYSHRILRRYFPCRFFWFYPVYLWLALVRTAAYMRDKEPGLSRSALYRDLARHFWKEVRRARRSSASAGDG